MVPVSPARGKGRYRFSLRERWARLSGSRTSVGVFPEIREARLDDAREIARLSDQFGYPAITAEIASRLAALARSETHSVWVAAGSGGVLLGWVAVEQRLLLEAGESAEIVGLVVDCSARRAGIGKALLAAVEQWARGRGLKEMVVRSNIVREASHRFYLGVGFRRRKTQHTYSRTL